MEPTYNLANIRALLVEGFADEELRRICYDNRDFRAVYDGISLGIGKNQIIDRLIEYCERRLLLDKLLDVLKTCNPNRYENHQPYYSVAAGTRTTTASVSVPGEVLKEDQATIPPDVIPLTRKMAERKVILFLGPSINEGCMNAQNHPVPLGGTLALLVKERFFPGEEVPVELSTICEYAEARESRRTLQHFIYDTYIEYKPSDLLKRIPNLYWRRIYTVNFDRLLEQAYDETPEKVQRLVPIYNDRDLQDFHMGQDVPYCKLNGCITKISSPDPALILTARDHANNAPSRIRLLQRVQDDLLDHTILFIGFQVWDRSFHDLFYELQSGMNPTDFPRCYAISPDTPLAVMNAWDLKKIRIFDLAPSAFFDLLTVTSAIQSPPTEEQHESITVLGQRVTPVLDLATASEVLKAFELVDDRLGYDSVDHQDYYRGNRPSWAIIRAKCDARRSYYESIMDDICLVDETKKPEPFELAIITAEAGAGKTTLLMRLAYDHACHFEGFCLFHRPFRSISIEALEELCRAVKRRIFIYLDEAADNIGFLSMLAKRAKALGLRITVVCAARKNEWNNIKDRLFPVVPVEYELPYLDDEEIDAVLEVLEQNNYLCDLANKTLDERRTTFRDKAEKQLLVAMRESTEGKEFDRIIQDEYDSIPSELGRRTYLHICSLHRLGVSIRAGLLRRLSNVSFDDFQRKLLEPCDRVIFVEYDETVDEYLYRTRHPHIAEIVCKYALRSGDAIASTYLQILSKMDLGYSSDMLSFRELARADAIIDAMPSIEHRRRFYDQALVLSHGDAFVYQQYGIMELRNNNIEEAERYSSEACRKEPRNQAYLHSYARVLFHKASNAHNIAQKDRLFKEAQSTLMSIMQNWPTNPYAYDSYAQNLISRVGEVEDPVAQDYLMEAHEIIVRGIRRCPSKSYLQATEAKIFQKLGDVDKAVSSLYSSHRTDPSSVRTALLLGRLLASKKEYAAALRVIVEALKFNEQHEALNFIAAQMALSILPKDHKLIIRYLKKAFDREYIDSEANFLLAVEYYCVGEYTLAEEIYEGFRQRKAYKTDGASYTIKEHLRNEDGSLKQFEGNIKVVRSKNGFIAADLLPRDVFFVPAHFSGGNLAPGMRVTFTVGFNLFGPIAQNIRPR